jgi:hypothetical protein
MKLTNKDKKYLISIGYNTEDFSEIEETTKHIKYELLPINQKEVIEILGRDVFLSGLGRATFHGSAVRYKETQQGTISIYFEKIK